MSKCHVKELSKLYEAIFEDAKYFYPTLEVEFEKDLARLRRLVDERGISVFVTDLPRLGKHLDRCLAHGAYKLSGLPLAGRVSGRVVIPKFLRGLYLRVFHESGNLKEDYDVEAIIFLRQILHGAKKTQLDYSDEDQRKITQEFIAVDRSLPELDEFWVGDVESFRDAGETYRGFDSSPVCIDRINAFAPERRGQLLILLGNLDKISGLLSSALGPYRFEEWNFRHGPGAISEATGPSNKYGWRNWSKSLESEFPIADCGFHNFMQWACVVRNERRMHGHQITDTEPFSRLICVPKTYRKPRLIAAEPSEMQWCQQNLWHYFKSRTADTWIGKFIRFTDQTLNQRLCVKGSESGELITVDLSAASDRVTPHVVGQLFRGNPKLLRSLRSTRTRQVQQRFVRNEPQNLVLRKFSTMGSACTFPVESLIFLGVALAACFTASGMPVTLKGIDNLVGRVSVFGDDIIVPEDSRGLLVDALELLWFKVNADKSFWTGKFRESCGVDSFAGVDVTPAYWGGRIGNNPDDIASRVDCSNNFYKKFFVRTSAWIASTVPAALPMVTMSSGVFGLKSFVKPFVRGKTRMNRHTQVMESLVLAVSASVQKTPTGDAAALLQYFTERPSPLEKWTNGYVQRPKLRLKARWVPVADIIS